MKHLYLFNTQSIAAEYGIGAYIRQLTACLAGNDILKYTLVQLDSNEKEVKAEYDESEKIRTIFIPRINYYNNEQNRKRYYRNLMYVLRLYISDFEENIFHFNYMDEVFFPELLKKQYPQSRLILTVHYIDWCFTLKGNAAQFNKIINFGEINPNTKEEQTYKEYVNNKQLFSIIDNIICLSLYTQQFIVDHYTVPKEKTSVIYNGLEDCAVRLSLERLKVAKESLFLQSNEKIILFAGRLAEIKGLTPLIKAFRLVLADYPKVHLIIAGNGSYDFVLKECSDLWKKITFTGKIDKEKLYGLYRIADIGVLPSFHEQCSYTAIEMMMHGLPLIGTDSTGLNEMIENGNNGYKIQLDYTEDNTYLSEKELSKIILQLLNADSQLISLIRKQSREMYEKRYSLEIMKQKMISFYLSENTVIY
jgi:glycosyltransferase